MNALQVIAVVSCVVLTMEWVFAVANEDTCWIMTISHALVIIITSLLIDATDFIQILMSVKLLGSAVRIVPILLAALCVSVVVVIY